MGTATKPDKSTPAPSDGLVAVVKKDCPTCVHVAVVLAQLSAADDVQLTVYSQDEPSFPADLEDVVDDTSLAFSWHNNIETVPTLMRFEQGKEVERIVGWERSQWEEFTGRNGLGPDIAGYRPGCGSLSVDPLLVDELNVRFGASVLRSRRVEFASAEDPFEATFDRGWTDGLPVVPPTEARVMAMLAGTTRAPDDIVATIPPDLVEVTVEQIAANAVMAGCKPEYLPVVLAAVEAACTDEFNMHGLLATTYFSGPIIVVNGPVAHRIGMNSTNNVLGQGNRANLTIGRALQLVVRNLGGGRPGGIDMALMGAPSKLGLCFAEREADSPFAPLAGEFGVETSGDSTNVGAVTLFAGQGPTGIIDQISRGPESLARSMAGVLMATGHPKLVIGFDAMLVVGPEHGRIFTEAGWDRARLLAELEALLIRDSDELIQGAGGIDEGIPAAFAGAQLPKFRPGGLQIVHAGGDAGLFSAVLGGWVGGDKGSTPTCRPITP